MLPPLIVPALKHAAQTFTQELSAETIRELFGTTDGKAIGTYVEQRFRQYLTARYAFIPGSSASGIDFPGIDVDLKVTSISQLQSSCPFRSASQKVYGLGYHLLVFVYEKADDHQARVAYLRIHEVVFVERGRTADWQTTVGIVGILERGGNLEDLVAFLEERNLPLDEIGRVQLAERIMSNPPEIGYLTMSNALQWRLQYGRVIEAAGTVAGVERLDG